MKGAVVDCPAVARCTVRLADVVLAGSVTVCPLATGCPFRVTVAFWNAPNLID